MDTRSPRSSRSVVAPFATSALILENFGLVFWAMLLVLPAIVYFRDAIAGMLLIVVMGYSALYLLHARHAAFAHGAQVDPAQMVRYVYVMMPVTVLATARGIGHFTVLLRLSYQDRFSSAGMALLSFLGFALAAPSVYQQRASMAEDEIQNRLQVLVLD